jgi:hypothetical protein
MIAALGIALVIACILLVVVYLRIPATGEAAEKRRYRWQPATDVKQVEVPNASLVDPVNWTFVPKSAEELHKERRAYLKERKK